MFHEHRDENGNSFPYMPINPRPDFDPLIPGEDEFAARRRVMVRHDNGKPLLFVAKANEMVSGWVIGVEMFE